MNKFVAMGVATLVVLLAIGGLGNAYAYGQRTRTLEQQWKDAEAAGVPRAKTDLLRARLQQIEKQRGGHLTFAVTSMALVENPLAGLQAQTQKLYDQVTGQYRSEAVDALAKLKQEYGPTPFDQARHEQQLRAASKPVDFEKLAESWSQEDRQLVELKAELGASSGGLDNGLPVDVLNARDQVQQTADKLRQAQLWTDPADQTLSTTQQYLSSSYQVMVSQHDQVKSQLAAGNDQMSQRLDLHDKGDQLVSSIPGLLSYGQGGDYASRADQAKQAFVSARDDDHLKSAVSSLQGIQNELYQKKQQAQQQAQQRLAAGGSGCEGNVEGKVILVSLSQQRLVACDGTSTAYSTPVTTGRPGMETPTGTTTVSFKQTPWLMKPEAGCKQGDPCWYRATEVNYVMLFRSGGYYLHDWPPQEGSAFGAGTEYGRFASHGCIHVPIGVLSQLYSWTPVGTTVIVTQ
jgi:hypothetical protein